MKQAIVIATIIFSLFAPRIAVSSEKTVAPQSELQSEVSLYLESKHSPLAPYANTLVGLNHWRLIIAISSIESQYCKYQLGNNCWGITTAAGGYAHYSDFGAGAIAEEALIERWQARGKWLTVESMNCSYVVPCNPNWVRTVNATLAQLSKIQ